MLKYTLGALAAATILLTTGFLVLSQVTDGGADQGRAPLIIVSAFEDGVWPPEIKLKRGEITELALRNESSEAKVARLDGDGVEQLPELSTGEEVGSRESRPYVSIEADASVPGDVGAESKLVRFSQSGRYTMRIYTPGVFLREFPVTVVVE